MNRRDFLKAIGAAAVTASVSSEAIAAVLEKEAAAIESGPRRQQPNPQQSRV